ncbi:protein inscuteable homolog [Schistocerca cancellata]|uniref:protein inscuteable homolog n=1 Tax=Schistocerca cancellata TaxID=274614 RepID=UPI0021179718|nr:protein inscuteable homolog [Schistocerca cancellata]
MGVEQVGECHWVSYEEHGDPQSTVETRERMRRVESPGCRAAPGAPSGGEWRRRPSKAWASEPPGLVVGAGRAASASPGAASLDSGYSDAQLPPARPATPEPDAYADILKTPEAFNASFSPLRTDTRLSWLAELEEPDVDTDSSSRRDSRPEAEQSPVVDSPLDCQPVCTSTPKGHTEARKAARPQRMRLRPPHNLLPEFNRSQSLEENAESHKNLAVHCWLKDLAGVYEPECTTTLQSKSLSAEITKKVENMAEVLSHAKFRHLQQQTTLISTELSKFRRQLDYGGLEHVGPLAQSLSGHILEFCQEVSPTDTNIEQQLESACDRLRSVAAASQLDADQIAEKTMELEHHLSALLDHTLKQHILGLLARVEEPPNDLVLRAALSGLTTLGLESPGTGQLVAECGGIHSLLTITLDSHSSFVRTASLRALAAVCCVAMSIRQFEQAGGVEILSELLADESRPISELSEAVGVLAQITSPWVEDNHSVHGLAEHLPSLVKSLTRMATPKADEQTLLLVAAALANMSHLEPRCVWPLLEYSTIGHLLAAVRSQGPNAPVFLREQTATLLANVAAVPETRHSLASQGATLALVCFLQVRSCPLQTGAEITAAERLQQKSAIALSRLCTDKAVAQEIVDLQGVTRLVRLCREDRERNHSDGVLVACLAALRKIAANCGTEVIEELDAMELVEPRLLDSFLLYSSRQESYV